MQDTVILGAVIEDKVNYVAGKIDYFTEKIHALEITHVTINERLNDTLQLIANITKMQDDQAERQEKTNENLLKYNADLLEKHKNLSAYVEKQVSKWAIMRAQIYIAGAILGFTLSVGVVIGTKVYDTIIPSVIKSWDEQVDKQNEQELKYHELAHRIEAIERKQY
jgi:hypothetical protein